jgi:membrane protease YdiL (CAAX protease family)
MGRLRKDAFLGTIAALIGMECASVLLYRLPWAKGFTPVAWTAMVRTVDIVLFFILFGALSVPIATAGFRRFVRGSIAGLLISFILGSGFFLVLHTVRSLWGVDLRGFVNPGPTVHPSATLAVLCLIGPFAEEIFFRGLCYTLIRAHTGIWVSVVLSAGLFGVSHLLSGGTPGVVLIPLIGGIAFALLYEFTESLFAPFILHAVANLVLFSGVL